MVDGFNLYNSNKCPSSGKSTSSSTPLEEASTYSDIFTDLKESSSTVIPIKSISCGDISSNYKSYSSDTSCYTKDGQYIEDRSSSSSSSSSGNNSFTYLLKHSLTDTALNNYISYNIEATQQTAHPNNDNNNNINDYIDICLVT